MTRRQEFVICSQTLSTKPCNRKAKVSSITEMPGRSKTKSICERGDAEAVRDLMVAYISRSCSLAQVLHLEAHCLVCDECLSTLAILQNLLRSPVNEEEEETLARYAAGREAADIARRSWKPEGPISDSCSHLRNAA